MSILVNVYLLSRWSQGSGSVSSASLLACACSDSYTIHQPLGVVTDGLEREDRDQVDQASEDDAPWATLRIPCYPRCWDLYTGRDFPIHLQVGKYVPTSYLCMTYGCACLRP